MLEYSIAGILICSHSHLVPAVWEVLKKRRLGQEDVQSTQEGEVSGQANFQVQLWRSPGKCSSRHWEGLVFSEQGGVDAQCQTLAFLLSP